MIPRIDELNHGNGGSNQTIGGYLRQSEEINVTITFNAHANSMNSWLKVTFNTLKGLDREDFPEVFLQVLHW